jgi:hypothetical protein
MARHPISIVATLALVLALAFPSSSSQAQDLSTMLMNSTFEIKFPVGPCSLWVSL